MSVKVSTSLLSADFCNLENEIKLLEKAGSDYLHIDVMDGMFVPNITIGQPVVAAIKNVASIPLDVHLMIQDPIRHIEDFAKSGSDIITIHYEATKDIKSTLLAIKNLGKKSGLSLRPETDESVIKSVISYVDQILVMTVNPGFGGQKLIESQLQKITNIKKMIDNEGLAIDISVDGGINADTAIMAKKAGANILVSGSFIFKDNYAKQINNLKK